MNTMKWVMSAAAAMAMCVVGCGGQSAADVALESGKAELTNGNQLYGSDTLKGAMVSANSSSFALLSIEGKGSGAGEGCMRSGSGTFCSGRQQTIAPMSREFNVTSTACPGGIASGTSGGVTRPNNCCPGERSNVVALDAVNAIVNTANPLTSISRDDLASMYFSSYTDSTGVVRTGSCWTNWNQVPGLVGGTFAGTIHKFRRDDLSGTTDTFKTLLGGTTFCADVVQVADGSLPAACSGLASATECIGALVAGDTYAIGYSGDSALRTGNKALAINGIAPTAANVRLLLTNPTAAYPLSRRLFLNENVNFTKDPKEQTLYDWVYANKGSFETILKNQGFIACNTTGALRCGGTNNDGRGAGVCKGL